MKRVLVSVEGQTEEAFIKKVLHPHLSTFEIHVIPVIVATRVIKQGGRFKGGLSSYGKAQRDLRRLLGDTDAAAVTTMYDYYQLPSDFPGYETRPLGDCYQTVMYLERQMEIDLGEPRFRAYLQVHEFEALLFSDPEAIAYHTTSPGKLAELLEIRNAFQSPEEINDGIETAPSKRIRRLCPTYQKPVHGVLISSEIGLRAIREQCSHFDAWVSWLEGLGRG